jgi:peptidoglycan/LPS O-acetylase OafA/YrhL
MKRNVQMDILRCLAILLVIGAHLELSAKLSQPTGGLVGTIAQQWHLYGGFGVPLFFVLSGFLIGGLLLLELRKHGRISISRFLIRRGFKIYPAYFAFLAYLFLMPLLKALLAHENIRRVAGKLFADYWPNFLFFQNYIGPNPAGHTWSLAVEEHFYLMLPFGIAALVATKRVVWLMPVCLLSPVFFTLVRAVSAYLGDPYLCDYAHTMAATHLQLDGLLLGVGLRCLAEFSPESFVRLRNWRTFFFLTAAILIFLPGRKIFNFPIDRIFPFHTIAAAALFIGIYQTTAQDFGRQAGWVRRLAAPFARIGVDSYSIYLWHVTALGIAGQAIVRLHWTSTASGWLVSAIAVSGAAIVTGIALARLIEWPVIRLRDRFFPSRS